MALKGIEYSEKQLLVELYQYYRDELKYSNFKIADVFNKWNIDCQSYLLKASIDILIKEEDDDFLLNQILDVAGGRGSGALAANTAVLFGAAVDTMSGAVSARAHSNRKMLREVLSSELNIPKLSPLPACSDEEVGGALKLAQFINHAIGFDMMMVVDEQYELNLNYNEVVRVWSGGSVLQSDLLHQLMDSMILGRHLLLMDYGKELVEKHYGSLVKYNNLCNVSGISSPVFAAALNYLQAMSTANSGANLIQAQRNYIYGQSYRRKDDPDVPVHSNWKTE